MTPRAICARICVVPTGLVLLSLHSPGLEPALSEAEGSWALLCCAYGAEYKVAPSSRRLSWRRLAATRAPPNAGEDASARLRAGAERQQGNIARLLDSRGEPPLVRRAHAAQPPGHDLAAFRHELREQAVVLVINGVNLLHAELAHLLAAEILASTFARTAGPAAAARSGSRCRCWRCRGCGRG